MDSNSIPFVLRFGLIQRVWQDLIRFFCIWLSTKSNLTKLAKVYFYFNSVILLLFIHNKCLRLRVLKVQVSLILFNQIKSLFNEFCGTHLRVLAPKQLAPFEEISQRWRTIDSTVSYLTSQRFEPQNSSFRDERATARPTVIEVY